MTATVWIHTVELLIQRIILSPTVRLRLTGSARMNILVCSVKRLYPNIIGSTVFSEVISLLLWRLNYGKRNILTWIFLDYCGFLKKILCCNTKNFAAPASAYANKFIS